jgi:antibiotic biosynthesis monooxygenase (ABM) superfamily enzyme
MNVRSGGIALLHIKEDPDDPPVTVDVVRQVKPGYEAEFELALADVLTAAEGFHGHLGTNVLRSTDSDHLEYRIIYKFAYMSCLKKWEESAIRAKLLEKLNCFTLGEGKVQRLTGLETWFTLPMPAGMKAPPRYKMVLMSWIVIFPLSNVIPPVLQKVFAPLPPVPRSAIAALCMVALMTYVVMPRVTKLFSFWLYPKSKANNINRQRHLV